MDRFLANKNVLRVIALILSITLWLTVQAPNIHSATNPANGLAKFPRPIHVQTDPNMVVTSIEPSVDVLEVKDSLLTTALSEQMLNVEVVADARKLSAGSHQITLQALNVPPVQFQLNPLKVTVTLAPTSTVKRSVRIVVQGKAKSGYRVDAPSSNVNSVVLSGAKKQLKKVKQVDAVIQLNGATSDLSEQVDLNPVDDRGQTIQGVTVNPSTATINVPIQSPENNVTVKPVVIGTPAPGYAVAGLSVSPSNVKFYGESVPGTIQLPVNVAGLTATQTQKVTVPTNQNVNKVSPSKVSVTVKIEPAASKEIKGVPVQIINVKNGQKVTLQGPKKITVQLTGPKSVINALSNSNVTAYIDASRLSKSDTQANVMVNTPQWVQVTQLSATQIPITVTQG